MHERRTAMKSLQTIQKTFNVFHVLAKIALIFCIVGASFCALGTLCCAVWNSGGRVFGLFGEPIISYVEESDMLHTTAVLLTDLIYLVTDIILLSFTCRYLKTELAAGTPFTKSGAGLLKNLGIKCIFIPIISIVICSVISVCMGAGNISDAGNLPGIVTGIVLILASLIFRYGAELEEKSNITHEIN